MELAKTGHPWFRYWKKSRTLKNLGALLNFILFVSALWNVLSAKSKILSLKSVNFPAHFATPSPLPHRFPRPSCAPHHTFSFPLFFQPNHEGEKTKVVSLNEFFFRRWWWRHLWFSQRCIWKLILRHSRNSPILMESRGPVSCSEVPFPHPYPEPDLFTPHPTTHWHCTCANN